MSGQAELGREHAQLLFEAGAEPVEVLRLLLETIRVHGETPGLLSDAAAMLHSCGRPDRALDLLQRALTLDPNDEDALTNLHDVCAALDAAPRREHRPLPDHEELPLLADPFACADPDLAEHAVAAGGILGPAPYEFGDPDAPPPLRRVAVIGGESSGTRLMARLLSRAGCEVLHRSFPYEGAPLRHWPMAAVAGYEPDAVVVMTRDWWASVPSQVRAGHVPDEATALANLRHAWQLTAQVAAGHDWVAVGYESLVQRPAVVVANVCHWLGIPAPDVGEIFDGNNRYLGDPSVRP